MVQKFVVECVCLRCGKVNEFELGLTNKHDHAVYRCNNCSWICITSWVEDDKENEE